MDQKKKQKRQLTAPQAGVRVRVRNQIVGSVTRALRRRQSKNPELTQASAAQKLGVTRQLLNRWINNPANWTLDTMGDLIYAFDLQIEGLNVVLDEDLPASNYVNPLSQQGRSTAPQKTIITLNMDNFFRMQAMENSGSRKLSAPQNKPSFSNSSNDMRVSERAA